MLDSLGSALSSQTTTSFFTRFGKDPFERSIAISQTVQCLESEEVCDNAPTAPRGTKMEGPPRLDKIKFSHPLTILLVLLAVLSPS